MIVTAVDQWQDLFRIEKVFPDNIVQAVINTDWLAMPWHRQEGQEQWARRRITNSALPWIDQWDNYMHSIWPEIERQLAIPLQGYSGTAFWLDEPGFTCALHTDGEMPGSLHLTWQGPGTTFYWYKNTSSVRYQVPSQINSGYIMINQADSQGFRKLLWHAMLDPVPSDSYRLTTYSWLIPQETRR